MILRLRIRAGDPIGRFGRTISIEIIAIVKIMRTDKLLITLLLAIAIGLSMPASHAMSGSADSFGLRKVGEGEFRWFGLSIYKAALWADENVSRDRLFGSTLMLTLEYDRKISKQRIVNTTVGEWRRISDEQLDRQTTRWASLLLEILPDVSAGDKLSSLVIPGAETRFYLDGVEIGRIDEPDFGPAFLAIWLDRKTRANRLRNKLLTRVGVST